MENETQTAFIRRVRDAVNPVGDLTARREAYWKRQSAAGPQRDPETIRQRELPDRMALLELLVERGKPLNLVVEPVKDTAAAAAAVADRVRNTVPEWGTQKRVTAWEHPLIDRLNLPGVLAGLGVPVTVTAEADATPGGNRRMRGAVEAAYIGVTSADFCLADTATLVMKTRPGQARSVSLVPSIHVAVITLDQIVKDLTELYALLKYAPDHSAEGLTNCMTFISGPSKTADIELTMVHGAHGPKALTIFVISGEYGGAVQAVQQRRTAVF